MAAFSIIISLALVGGGFGYLVHKIGWKASVAAVAALGAGIWAGGREIAESFVAFIGMFGG